MWKKFPTQKKCLECREQPLFFFLMALLGEMMSFSNEERKDVAFLRLIAADPGLWGKLEPL